MDPITLTSSRWVLSVSQGVKACQDGLWHFFPTFARGCKGLPGWFGAIFFTFARFTQGGGAKAIWAMPI